MYPRQQHSSLTISSPSFKTKMEKGAAEESLLKKYLKIFAVVSAYW
jgi:hypothetical protein